MAAGLLPPPPINDQPGSFAWMEWLRQLREYVSQTGSVPWAIIDFTGSNINDIALRRHNTLQSLQGGITQQYYHLTRAQHIALTDVSVVSDKLFRLNKIQYREPITGFDYTIASTTGVFVLEPAGTLATGTITMPEAPVDNQEITITSTEIITALTQSPNTGQTIMGGVSTLLANEPVSWVFRESNSTWYRI